MLVGMPKAPSSYDPTKHLDLSISRANNVISRMYNLGWISKADYDNIGNVISYCSFANNTATKQYCIILSNEYNTETCKNEVRTSNIIENKANRTIYSRGETNFYHCSLYNHCPK